MTTDGQPRQDSAIHRIVIFIKGYFRAALIANICSREMTNFLCRERVIYICLTLWAVIVRIFFRPGNDNLFEAGRTNIGRVVRSANVKKDNALT
jgi:hypothetical protein